MARPYLEGATEQIVLIDDEGPALSGSKELLSRLRSKGFNITRRLAKDIPPTIGLRGVPLLIITTPDNRVVYSGGYGAHEDQDAQVLRQVKASKHVPGLPVLGCALGAQLRRSVDPFHLKY